MSFQKEQKFRLVLLHIIAIWGYQPLVPNPFNDFYSNEFSRQRVKRSNMVYQYLLHKIWRTTAKRDIRYKVTIIPPLPLHIFLKLRRRFLLHPFLDQPSSYSLFRWHPKRGSVICVFGRPWFPFKGLHHFLMVEPSGRFKLLSIDCALQMK